MSISDWSSDRCSSDLAGVSGLSEFAGQIAAGKLRGIAISSPERLEGVDVPTLIEGGVNVDLVNWRAVVAPPGLDDAERQQLLTTVDALAKSATWQSLLKERNWMDSYLAGDEFAARSEEHTSELQSLMRTSYAVF